MLCMRISGMFLWGNQTLELGKSNSDKGLDMLNVFLKLKETHAQMEQLQGNKGKGEMAENRVMKRNRN